MYKIKQMSKAYAKEMLTWKYEGEYSIYSMDLDSEFEDEILGGTYYYVKSENELVGFFCYGKASQVPSGYEYGAYADSGYLDIGLGMKPEFCGKGLGYYFLLSGVEYAKDELGADKLRLTVADFNKRAIKVYERAGFKKISSFTRSLDNIKFNVMVCDL